MALQPLIKIPRFCLPFIGCLVLFVGLNGPLLAQENDLTVKESWQVHRDFNLLRPRVIAVLPMDNLSLEPNLEKVLRQQVYDRIVVKGYSKIRVTKVEQVMDQLGIQTPGQLAGISLQRLGKLLNCEAILRGHIDQSAAIHDVIYDAVVVSCSLQLIHCKTGTVLWEAAQWRTAHRQWAVDPFNILINLLAHAGASREDRIAYLVQEMFKTLPQGPVKIETDNLLNRATPIEAKEE